MRKSPFGYYIVNRGDVLAGRHPASDMGRYLVVEEEARWIRLIFELRLTGKTFADILRQLNATGTMPRRGTPWNASDISRYLSNPVYKGEATFGALARIRQIQEELNVPVLADIATVEEALTAAEAGAAFILSTIDGIK